MNSQDWNGIAVPPSPGSGNIWELQENVSDDFNYEAAPNNSPAIMGGKWNNWYHNGWSGPLPTEWRRDHIFVEDGTMKVITSRPPGDSVWVGGQKLATTNIGCASSTMQVQYPVYIETRMKIMKSVLASNVWLLSSDDTQEIDICEAYGSERWTNSFFSDKRLHLSHHVFIRQPFTDWQPNDAGSFYTDGTTVWSDGYHRIGVYWIDPWNLEYYVDGELVRTRSGQDEIDPLYHTNAINPGDVNNDTRTGLSKPMDIIVNTEDQTWRAEQGLTPTDAEMANADDNTFQVDWIRVYKPVVGQVGPVTAVMVDPAEVTTIVGANFAVQANITPNNADDLSVSWNSDNSTVATVNAMGEVETHAEGVANIIVTTTENSLKDTCVVTVITGVPASLEFDDDSTYLTTNYDVGGFLTVSCNFHAGTGNTVAEGGQGGMKFWLREIQPGWSVANDYLANDASVIGQESGTATATISLIDVPATAEIPEDNWYFLYLTFQNSAGESYDLGIYPINLVNTTATTNIAADRKLSIFPNPTQSVLNIKVNPMQQYSKIEIIDASGKNMVVPIIDRTPTSLQLDSSQLPKGFYMIRLVADKVYLAPFIKE